MPALTPPGNCASLGKSFRTMQIFAAKRKKQMVAAIALGLLGLGAAYVFHLRQDMSDFGVCYQAGERIRAGETLYRPSDGHMQFKYAPLSAVFFVPFSLLPLETAKAAWFIVEIVLLTACLALAYRSLAPPRKKPLLVLGLTILVLAKFIGREFELGQVNLLILFLVLASLAAWRKGREGWAGVLWGLSLFFKPYALVFLPYVLLRRRFRILAAGAATVAAGLAVPMFLYGWTGNLRLLGEWVGTLTQSTPVLLEVGDNASLYAFLAKHIGRNGLSTGLFFGIAALLAGSVLWLMIRARRDGTAGSEMLDFAFLLVLVPLLSPLGWYYNYLYGLAAVAVILNSLDRLSPAWRYTAGIDLLLIGGTLREVLGKTAFRFYTHHSLVALNFLVILLVLVHLRKRDIA
jgi:Glycosyltransferase family 87